MERKKRRKGAPSGAWKTHFNERRQRPRCLWTIWTRKSHHKSHHTSNYTCNFALFITLALLLCEYRISSLVFFFLSIAEQTGQRDVGQLDTLALAWRPSDKCSYFVSISSPHHGVNMQERREDSILCFVYNEYFEYVIVIIPLQGSLLGRLNRKILFWKHNNILFLFSVLQR